MAGAHSARALLRCVLTSSALLGVGCALDTRSLHPGEASAGSTSGGSGSGSSSAAGTHSATQPPAVDLPVCSYSDGVAPGCESIVDNAGFQRNIAPWAAEPLAITVAWDATDADGSDASGSILVTNSMHGTNDGLATGGGMLCLPAVPGQIFDMAGDIFIPKGQGDGVAGGPYVGQAGFSILFWPSEECSDLTPTQGNFQTSLVSETEKWQHVEGSALAPEKTKSMSMRVLTVKAFKEFTFKAFFDNVLLQKR